MHLGLTQLRAGERSREHERRGLLPAGAQVEAAAARERGQVLGGAGSPQCRGVPARLRGCGRYRHGQEGAAVSHD